MSGWINWSFYGVHIDVMDVRILLDTQVFY